MKKPPFFCSVSLFAALISMTGYSAHADLLVWWSFDEEAGSDVVVDQSGNDNDGDLINFDFTEESDFVPDGGKFGGAILFDGFDDYVGNATDFQPKGEAFTYSYFFKPAEDDYAEGHERDDHIYSNARPHFSFSRDNGGDGQMGMYYNIGADTQVKTTTSEWSSEEWHHVAWTYNGVDVVIYVNGVEEDSQPGGGVHTVQGDGRFNLGSNAGASAAAYNGFMDDLTVWDEALSPSDILTIAQDGVAQFLEQRNVDSDGDDLPDIWEQQIVDASEDDAIATVTDVTGDADFDNDGSSNANEFAKSTDPTDPDTDDDTLLDGVETNTGIWVSLSDTGTNPGKADTDEDGLADNVENPDLAFDPAKPAEQPGTNPNTGDSDGDGFLDLSEVNLGTDPTDPASKPELGTRILFVGGALGDPTTGADQAVMDFLVERYGEENVDYVGADEAQTGDELEYSVLILSSTFGSGSARGKFQDSIVPILNWEEAIARDAAGEFAMASDRPKDNSEHSIVIKVEHPITAGFDVDSTVQLTDGAAEFWWATGDLAPGSVALACDDDDDLNSFLQIIEQGDELINGSPSPGRRIMLGFTDATFNVLTDDALTLFGQAVDWLAGLSSSSSGTPFQVTTIEPSETEVTLTFTSKEGGSYTVQRSAGLSDWLELTDGLASDGEATEYVDSNLPDEKSELYYRIVQE
ncbi:MAG: LamG-like jellyroll fold domain-containing protein [Verrucomicrobiales bacterium]